jgi:hypothetical protein
MKLIVFALILLVLSVTVSPMIRKLNAKDPQSETQVDLPKLPSDFISKNESSTETQVDLPKLPSDFISKNESSAAVDNVPMPDKFNPLFHNSGQIENTINCDISGLHRNGTEMVTCTGTAKNDKIVGTSKSDEINSLEGDDFILGGKGRDTLFGSEGGDQINGGSGDDVIYGGNGEDLIFAGSGNDLIFENYNKSEDIPYKDLIDCGTGDDRVYVDDIDVYKNCEIVNDVKVKVGIESEPRPPSGLLP